MLRFQVAIQYTATLFDGLYESLNTRIGWAVGWLEPLAGQP